MPRVLRFFWQMPDTPYTTAEWLCVPFVLVMHLVLGFPFFIYGVLGLTSRSENKFRAEQDQRARCLWEQREALRRRGRVIEGVAVEELLNPPRGCFLDDLHAYQLWWVDAEADSFKLLAANKPPPKDPQGFCRALYLDLLDEEQGRALLLEFPDHRGRLAFEDRIPLERRLNISQTLSDEVGHAVFCFKLPTAEELAQLFPESDSTPMIKHEQKPFWGRYWRWTSMGYVGLLLLIALPLLPLIWVLSVGDWLSVAGLWLLADIMQSMTLGAWAIRNDFSQQQQRSWWRSILRWVMPSFSIVFLYSVGFSLCVEAGYPERYLLGVTLHLAANALWRVLLTSWYDPFVEEFDPPMVFDADEETHSLRPTES